MGATGDFSSPKQHLAQLGLHPKKSFGQNFLADAHLTRRIAELCCPAPGGTVIEIGAGLGALTAPLLEAAGRVVAIERDRELVPALRARFDQELSAERLKLIEADAKQIDFVAELDTGPRPHVLAGNLPYQITGLLIEQCVRGRHALDRAVFLVQLEVAERLAAAPGNKVFGALTVFTQAAFRVERALVVKRGAFYPQPQVDSAVVVLSPRADAIEETPTFRALVKGAFHQRRKQLRNAWRSVAPAEAVATAAERTGVDLAARGESLSVEVFGRMAKELTALTVTEDEA